MPETFRGISGPEDIQSQEDALRLVGVDVDASSEEIATQLRLIFPETHPDADGTTELFQAVQLAEDALTGETRILPSGGRASESDPNGIDVSIVGGSVGAVDTEDEDDGSADDFDDFSSDDSSRGPDSGGATPGGWGGFGDAEQDSGGVNFGGTGAIDAEAIVKEIKGILRENIDREELKERYGDIANFQNVAEILAAQFIDGNLTIGQIENMVGGGDSVYGSVSDATGGLYSNSPSGARYGSGSAGSNFSDSPSDARYSPGNVDVDAGDDDDDDDDS